MKLLEEKKITEEAKSCGILYRKSMTRRVPIKITQNGIIIMHLIIYSENIGMGEDKRCNSGKDARKIFDLGEDIRKSVLAGISNIKNNILESLSSDIDNGINSDCSSAMKGSTSWLTVQIKIRCKQLC